MLDRLEFLIALTGDYGAYGMDLDYYELTSDEKNWIRSFRNCLNNPNEKVQDAAIEMVYLVLELITSIDTQNELSREDVQNKKDLFCKDLTDEEKELINNFGLLSINCFGIYPDERENESGLVRKKNE